MDSSGVTLEIVEPTTLILSDLLKTLIKDTDLISKIQLDSNTLSIINMIIQNHPEVLNNVSNDISIIIADKNINMADIPQIILLIKDSYNLIGSAKDLKLSKKNIIDFIKYTMIILIESNFIKCDNKDLIVSLINLSINLLESEVNLDKKINCKCF